MPNIKFIGASDKENNKRLYCQLHLTIAKGKYQTVKIPLKSLVTGKPYVVRQDILLPNTSKGSLAFAEKMGRQGRKCLCQKGRYNDTTLLKVQQRMGKWS